jgi:hypothetical protein
MTDLPDRILEAIEAAVTHARLLDEHLSGHDRPYNPDDPTDPTVVLRHCEADKRTVQRHAPERIKDRYWCTHCERLWPCVEILDRADAYGIAKETGDQT